MSYDSDNTNLCKKTAYITLDDGPNGYTYGILDILGKYNIKATFFLLETNMRKNRDLIKALIKDGHSVGLHGVSHDKNKIYKSEKIFIDEMNACNDTLENITGTRTRLIRTPYGSFPHMNKNFRSAVEDAGYILWDWNVDSTDGLKPDASISEITEITKNNILKLQNEKTDPVILFHDRNISEGVLINIIDFLQKNEYIIKPLSENIKSVCFWDKIEKNLEPYTVVEGDTLWKISQKFEVPIQVIKDINGLATDIIYIGQMLYARPKNIKIASSDSLLIINGNTTKKQIAFTYDSGFEDTETSVILDILKKHKIKCTFFLTGFWVEKFPNLAKRIASEGHEIGNHSYKHPDMVKISHDQIIKSITDGENVIKKVIGINPRPLFREPYGSWNKNVLKAVGEAGYRYSIYWSLDTIDWQLPPTQVIVNRILKKAKNGDIVLMHVAGSNTAAATDIAIENLKARGFEFVTVSELLNIK